VHLHRDAPASIGSLIEAWETESEAHATLTVDGRQVSWMMLCPPGWLDRVDDPVPVKAAFQWQAAQELALQDLADVPADRVLRVSYEDLLADPVTVLLTVLEQCELDAHPEVLSGAERVGRVGRTSLSAPREGKWRARAADIEPLLPDLADVRRRLGYEV
jgi:hypothetical protein